MGARNLSSTQTSIQRRTRTRALQLMHQFIYTFYEYLSGHTVDEGKISAHASSTGA